MIEKKIRLLSLFSGCGGLDLGFEGGFTVLKKSINPLISDFNTLSIDDNWVQLPLTSFKTVFANDINLAAKSAWVNYFSKRSIPENTYKLDSIVNLVKQYHDGETSLFPNNIDVVTGGFPCQDFSIAGKRQGFSSGKNHYGKGRDTEGPCVENRGQLYMWMREVIKIVKPKVFIAENVKGLATLGDVKKTIEKDFASISNGGYLVVPAKILLAADFGVAQKRERIFFIGFKRSALNTNAYKELSKLNIDPNYDPYPTATHSCNPSDKVMPHVKVIDALHGLQEPSFTKELEQQSFSKAKFLPRGQGNKEIDLNGLAPTIRAEHHGNIEFRRLSAEHGGKYLNELELGMLERRLTIRECARLQSFPDDYKFILKASQGNVAVSASSAYKLIGNAVPPLLAYHIAKRLEEKWTKYFSE